MIETHPSSDISRLSLKHGVLLSVAIVSFQLAYSFNACSFLVLVYLACLSQLSSLPSTRLAFYFGLAIGGSIGATQADFFWNIFGPAAIVLWFVLGFWTALFLALARAMRARFGKVPAMLLIPFLWTGLEYFRSELYYLRFSWFNSGYTFSHHPENLFIKYLGMYGIGLLLMAVVSLISLLRLKFRVITSLVLLIGLAILSNLPSQMPGASIVEPAGNLRLAGIQLEFPSESEVVTGLNQLLKQHPEAELLVLSEYTILGPVPDSIKSWCQKNQRHLIIGAKDPVSDSDYYDTAFVIDPHGDIVFQQGKSVPIQFFKDGLPAREQKIWNSPWGPIGICICYDLSYTRITDGLIRRGAQAIIVPSMDIIDWGRHQHELHARVAPIRAAEYGVPIFRLASSGISQCVDSHGRVLASAPVPGEGAIISGTLNLGKPGTLPIDRFLGPLAVGITGLVIGLLMLLSFVKSKTTPATLPLPA